MEINKHIHACDGCGAAVQCCSLFCIPLEETDAGGEEEGQGREVNRTDMPCHARKLNTSDWITIVGVVTVLALWLLFDGCAR